MIRTAHQPNVPPRRLRIGAAAVLTVLALTGCGLGSPPREEPPRPGEGASAAPAGPERIPLQADAPTPDDGSARGLAQGIAPGWVDATANAVSIPAVALEAYAGAELWAEREHPGCGLRWTTLAGIGWVESRHGTLGGNSLLEDGTTADPITGIPLDGSEGVARIPDTDDGELDGDDEFDRAVGPMQFIPESWGRYGRDGDGDGKADPHNIYDAAVGAAVHLCGRGGDLSADADWVDAVLGYNRSGDYVRQVNARAEHVLALLAYAKRMGER